MIDLMLIAGSALCVLSIIMAVVSVAQTRAPRGAAIALMLGIIVLLIGAKMEPASINVQNMVGAWKRLFAGEVSLSHEAPVAPAASVAETPAVAPPASDAPASDATASSAPTTAPTSGEAAPATSEPAANQPATTQ